jgi:magnesium chelatase family protein
VRNYLGKVSGPLLDRFDLIIEVPALSHAELLARGNDDEQWLGRCHSVAACRQLQHGRQQTLNSDLSPAQLDGACELTEAKRAGLVTLFDKLKVSARGAHRVLRVARTIADYDGSAEVTQAHYLEAAGYRRGGFEGVY